MPLSLIQALNEVSIIEEEDTNQTTFPYINNTNETPLSPIEDIDEEEFDRETYAKSVTTDSHDYEFLSTHSCSTYSVFRDYDNQPDKDNGIEYGDISIYPPSIKYVYDINRICMLSTTSPPTKKGDLCLMYPHLIDWGWKEKPKLD